MRTLRAFALALLLLALTAPAALAHTPIFLQPGGEAPLITDPERSWAIYGRIDPRRAPEAVFVDAKAGQKLKLALLVPKRPELQEFRPRVVLLGPGLDPKAAPADLPIALERGEGALVLPEPAAPGEFYEPFTQTRYWTYGEVTGTFPATGRYKIIAYDPQKQGGPFTIALGEREQFGAADLLTFPATWLKVRGWFKR